MRALIPLQRLANNNAFMNSNTQKESEKGEKETKSTETRGKWEVGEEGCRKGSLILPLSSSMGVAPKSFTTEIGQ